MNLYKVELPDVSPHPQKILPDESLHVHRVKHREFGGTFLFRRQFRHLYITGMETST